MCRVTFSRATCIAVQRSFRKDVLTNQRRCRPSLQWLSLNAAVTTQCLLLVAVVTLQGGLRGLSGWVPDTLSWAVESATARAFCKDPHTVCCAAGSPSVTLYIMRSSIPVTLGVHPQHSFT